MWVVTIRILGGRFVAEGGFVAESRFERLEDARYAMAFWRERGFDVHMTPVLE